MRVFKVDRTQRTKSVAEIFSGHVETITAVGGQESADLRLSEVSFRNGARTRWHIHSTDQILLVTEGEGILAGDAEENDLTSGTVAIIPANTRHWHGAKLGKDMTHWSILGPANTEVVD